MAQIPQIPNHTLRCLDRAADHPLYSHADKSVSGNPSSDGESPQYSDGMEGRHCCIRSRTDDSTVFQDKEQIRPLGTVIPD